jgi:hypothetical protein
LALHRSANPVIVPAHPPFRREPGCFHSRNGRIRYHDAWYQLAAVAEAHISPLTGSNAPPADSAFFALLISHLTEDAGLSLA